MSLVDELRHLLNLSHLMAWEGALATGKPNAHPDEPGLVAEFFKPAIQSGIEKALRAHYGTGVNVEVHSIFTHKTPTVQPLTTRLGPAGGFVPIPGKTPVEIADLLLVRQHFVTSPTGTHALSAQGKALLLQAKKNKSPDSGDVSSGNPLTQMELYRDWPPFYGKGRLDAGPWDFKLNGSHRNYGEYLAVYDGQAHVATANSRALTITPAFSRSTYPSANPNKTAWASGIVPPTTLPADHVQCSVDFSEALADVLTGSAGESFTAGVHSGSYDWSRFVNRMIQVGARGDYTFVSRRTNIKTPSRRGTTIQAFMAIQPILQLAIAQEMREYVPELDASGFPNYQHEPYFYMLAADRSPLVRDLMQMDGQLRQMLPRDGEPPRRRGDDDFGPEDEGGHVPMVLITSSGPEPLWDDGERQRPRELPEIYRG